MKNILLTGGAGFIGFNFVKSMLEDEKLNIINLDLLTYAGNLENLKEVENKKNYTFVKGDICDKKLVKDIFEKYDIDTLVNFAAESHVDRSIENPEIFLQTNVLGTLNLLDNAKKYWKINKQDKYSNEYKTSVKYLQVSTDEVYGALGKTGMFVETMPLVPNSPYSVSKASADMLTLAYKTTYGLPVNITRCSNNYGPYQFPEKLIPLMINNCKHNKKLPVYGDGMQVRDWLHVKDHCIAIKTVLEKGELGEVYNVGGNNEKANIEIVKLIIKALGKDESLIEHVQDRLGHDRRYAIDNTKITSKLNWKPSYTFEQGIKETVEWYLNNSSWMDKITSGDYLKYYENMYKDR